jgi:lipid II:glycine glycyltransferase (peptidoglycan interpeptide bridge formation enzyme)
VLIDLSKPLEVLTKELSKKWRENLRRANRNNLDLKYGTDLELYDSFTKLYKEMHSRKQFKRHVDVYEYRKIQNALSPHHKMRIMICEDQGTPIAGLVWSAIGSTGIPIFSATGDNGLKARGSYLLRWNMLLQMKQDGLLFIDQGGVNKSNNPGGYRFKSEMGGTFASAMGQFEISPNLINKALIFLVESGKSLIHGFKMKRMHP